jgi:hypothetical protein
VGKITRAAALRVGRFGFTAAGRIRPTRHHWPGFRESLPFGIFCGTLLKEMRVLHDVEDFDWRGQRMWPHLAITALGGFEVAEDGQRLELGKPPICDVAELGVNLFQASYLQSRRARERW